MRKWKSCASAALAFMLLACNLSQPLYAAEINGVTAETTESSAEAENNAEAEPSEGTEPAENAGETEPTEEKNPAENLEVTEPVVNFRVTEDSAETEASSETEEMSLFVPEENSDGMLTATEVEGESRLDGIWKDNTENTAEETRNWPVYTADEIVTIIVELNDAPVMDYYDVTTYAASDEDTSAGEAVSEFLASDDVKEAAEELIAEQESVISEINELMTEEVSAYSRKATAGVEVLGQWSIITNAFAVEIPYGKLDEVRELPDVKRAYVQHVYSLPEPVNTAVVDGKSTYSYSYDLVGVEDVWSAGYTGKGMLVAVLDSGLDIKTDWEGKVVRTHEAFTEDSFMSKSEDGTFDWELRYTEESMTEFLAETQLVSNTGNSGNHITYDNNALYKNIKVPYAADYADGDVNVCPSSSDHGTHVSGTIAGYAKTEEGEVKFSGIAPDAQILMMKVFPDADGGAEEISIISALEDSLKLGADMINLSLGSDNGYETDDTAQNDTFARIEAAGIVMMTSAGNSSYSTAGNNYGGDNLTSNPDISMISSPAVYESNLSVASSDNVINVQSYFTWTDDKGEVHEVAFSDPYTVAMKSTFSDGEYPLIAVDGVGTYSDYYSAGFDNGWNGGKTGIALVKRGEISFSEKVNNALSFSGTNSRGQRYGVQGVIIYDNDPNGTELINMSVDNVSLTSAFISGKDGEEIVAALKAGYQVKIKVAQSDKVVDNGTAGEISSYSSWGAGPGLELKPEITAPGGNIWSTILDTKNTANDGYTGSYGMMSGTSMAAPHMTGIAALIRQYIKENNDKFNVSDEEMGDLISQLLVSTATPLKDTNGVYYSPRQQGAGLVNANAAVNTPAYLSMDGQNVAKLELSDDPQMTGTYDIGFDINNVSNQSLTYNVSIVLMRPDTESVESEWGTKTVMKENDVVLMEQDLGSVSVPANSTKKFATTVSLSEEVKAELSGLFENGSYVEGYVILTDAAGTNPQLGVPMLAFFGDWTKAPIIDSANWYDEPADGESIYSNENTWGVNFVGSCVWSDYDVINFMDLGMNPFMHDAEFEQNIYHEENFTLSPDGNGYLDQIDDYVIYQIRNARVAVIEVKDSETGELYFRDWASYPFKTTYAADYGTAIPYSAYGTFPTWNGTDLEGNILPDGTKCTFSIYTYGEGDYGDEIYVESEGRYVTNFDAIIPGENEPTFNGHKMDMTGDVISFGITIDTEPPKLKNNAVSVYEKDGRTYISGTVYDEDGYLASLEILPIVTRTYKEGYGNPEYAEDGYDRSNPFYLKDIYDPATKELTFEADVTEYVHANESYAGENYYYNFDWTGNIMLFCGDYGANDRGYAIKVDSTSGLVLSQTSALLHPGDTFELSVNNNTGKDDTVLTRTSSNPEVATIDEYGMITAIAPGQAVMTVSDGTNSATCVVAVQEYNTVVEDFDLSIESFKGLKPNGELVVKVTNLQPADVVITEKSWSVSESDEYAADYASGLIQVAKESEDGLSGKLYTYYTTSTENLPAGLGTLTVTLNGVSRSMEIGWDDIYTAYDQDDVISSYNYEEQDTYITLGETATLSAKYRQSAKHSVGDVITILDGLQLDGPDFFSINGSYSAKLVNEENYTLPENIAVYIVYNYSDGSTYEYQMSQGYYGYSYNAATGEISIPYAPSGSTNDIKIVATGVESEGNPAGEMSGTTYTRPDSLYGPFDWTVTEGTGTLELTEVTDYYGDTYEAAQYTPTEPGVSYITASSKDGLYSVNFAVITSPVKAETLSVDTHRVELTAGETAVLNATLDPIPTLEEDKGISYTSYEPSVATIDESGAITAVSEGYAFIKIYSSTNNKVFSYCVVHVNAAPETPVVPDTPVNPEVPVTPEVPGTPEIPVTPITPVIPETPATSNTQDNKNETDKSAEGAVTISDESSETENTYVEGGKTYRRLSSTGKAGFELAGDAGLIAAGTQLHVEEYAKDSFVYQEAAAAVAQEVENCRQFAVYEIDLTNKNGVEIHEVGGYIAVTMPLPEGFSDGKVLTMYRLEEDGTLTKCDTTVKDGKITFLTDHFSTYILTESNTNAVKTSDEVTSLFVLDVLLLIGAVMMLCALYRKKRYQS